ncbi:MAG: aconitase family protein, partial [Sphingopyxis sp.]
VVIDAADIAPSVTWGTSPEDVVPITGVVPDPASFADPSKQAAAAKSLAYIEQNPGSIRVERLASPSHSFAGDDAEWLAERILAALK